MEQPIYAEDDFDNVDLWLITHAHEDHLDAIGITKISPESEVVCNRTAHKTLTKNGLKKLAMLNWHQQKTYRLKGFEVTIEGIPAIHGVNPIVALIIGKVNGYLISIKKGSESATIYVTGDTVYTRSIKKALHGRGIDLMIPNMGAASEGSWLMTLTLNAKMLKRIVKDLHPKKVIPVHYGTFAHYTEPKESVFSLDDSRITIVKTGQKTSARFA
jgi:L-ascorbate metabolism protein UlaG (beta-lactamase superfamily)